jgi:hypothetical protein
MTEEDFEHQRKIERKRRLLATIIAAKGSAAVPLGLIEEVLRAIREAGYLVIDKSRVVNVQTSHMFTAEQLALGNAVDKMKAHMRKIAAIGIGRHMLDKGGIEFEEREARDGSLELRSSAYVIWPKPHGETVRDETTE